MTDTTLFEHGGNIHQLSKRQPPGAPLLIDFSANINPQGLPASVRQAVDHAFDDIIHYPDIEAHDLKQAIVYHYGVNYDSITAGNGAVELLYILCHIYKPKRVLIPVPAFSEYERASKAAGAAIHYCYVSADNGFQLQPAQLLPLLPQVDIVFIGNPNNPTGCLLTRQQLEQIITAAAQTACLVVVDESFIDFLPQDHPYSCRPLLAKYTNLVIIHSLTKFYAIPGLRLGFALTTPALAAKLHAGKDPWNVNSLAQAAGAAALADQAYGYTSRQMLAQAKQQLYQSLLEIDGLTIYPPSVNFILINLAKHKLTGGQAKHALLKHGMIVRDCTNYPGLTPYYIRIAIKRPSQNQQLVAALRQIVKSL